MALPRLYPWDDGNQEYLREVINTILDALDGGAEGANTTISGGTVTNPVLNGSVPAVPAGLAVASSAIDNLAQVYSVYANLTWTANGTGDHVNVYEIQYRKQNDINYYKVQTGLTSIKIPGLIPGQAYSFSIRALNTYGWSTFSSEVTSTMPSQTATPAVPTGLTVTGVIRGYNVLWNANGEADLAGYVLQVSPDNTTWSTAMPQALQTTFYFELTNGSAIATARYFRVAAINRAGLSSAYSASVSGTTAGLSAADFNTGIVNTSAIVNGAVTNAILGAGSVSATKVGFTTGGGNVLYNSSFEDVTGFLNHWNNVGGTWTADTTTFFSGSQSAKFVASAAWQKIASIASEGFIAHAGDILTASVWYYVPSTSGITWFQLGFEVVKSDGTTHVNWYNVDQQSPVVGAWTRQTFTSTIAAGDITAGGYYVRAFVGSGNVSTGTIYFDAVQLERGDLPTSYAPRPDEILPQAIIGNMMGSTTPAVPTGVATTTGMDNTAQVNNAYINVTWNANLASDYIQGYSVRWRKSGDSLYYYGRATTTNFKIGGLIPNQAYQISVLATNNINNSSAYSTEVSQTTANASAPTTPTGLSATSAIRGFMVQWNANTEADLQGYQLQTSPDNVTWTTQLNTSLQTSFYFTPPSSGGNQTFYFRIRAVNWSGQVSAYTASISSSTDYAHTGDLAGNSVTNAILAANSVASGNIQNNAVGPAQISAVNASQLASTGTPATVTGVTATAGIQSIYVYWTPNTINDAYQYEISEYVGTSSATTPPVGSTTLPLSAATFVTLSGRTTGQAYTYWVRAKNYSGTFSAAYSAPVTATPVAAVTGDLGSNAVTAAKIANGAVTAPALSVTIGGTNIITNSSVEDGTNLGAFVTDGTGTFTRDNAHAFDGLYAAKFVANATAGTTHYVYINNVPSIAGIRYTGSAWVYLPVSQSVTLQMGQVTPGDSGASTVSGTSVTVPANTWTRIQATRTAPAGETVQFISVFGINANATVWVDGWQVEVGDVPTAYAPRVGEVLPSTITTSMIQSNAITNALMGSGAVQAGNLAVTLGGGNLVSNSSFEDTTALAGASPYSLVNVTTSYDTASSPPFGTYAFKVQRAATGDSYYFMALPGVTGATLNGQKVTISFYAKADVASSLFSGIFLQDAHGGAAGTLQPNITTTWTRYSTSFTVGSAAFTAADPVHLVMRPLTDIATNNIYYDGVQVEIGDVLTAYAPKASELLTGQVNNNSIAANAVTANKIVAGTITSDRLYTGAVQANLIQTSNLAAGSITAGVIAAGTITGDRINSGTITTTNLIAGFQQFLSNPNPLNALRNPDAESGLTYWGGGSAINNATLTLDTTAADSHSGNNCFDVQFVSSQFGGVYQSDEGGAIIYYPLTPGTTIYFGGWINVISTGGQNVSINLAISDKNKTNTGTYPGCGLITGPLNTWQYVSGTYVVQTGDKYAAFYMSSGNQAGAAHARYDDLFFTVQIPGAGIVAGSITADRITANSLTSAQIQGGSITSDRLYSGAVQANLIQTSNLAAGSITAGVIAANTITGAQIAANTVATTNLTVGSFQDSAIPNGSFEELSTSGVAGTLTGWTQASLGSASSARSQAVPAQDGGWIADLQSNLGTNNFVSLDSVTIPVTPGDTWYVSGWFRSDVANSTQGGVLRTSFDTSSPVSGDGTWYDVNVGGSVGTVNVTSWLSSTTTWQQAYGLVTVPAGKYYMKVRLYNYQPGVNLHMYFDNIQVRKAVGTANILNAAIKNAQIDQLAVATANIQDAAIVNAKINDVTVDKLTAGNLKVNATLTTGNLQTAASGARVVLDSSGLRAYDNSSNNTVNIKNDGSATYTGTIYSSGLASGSIVAPTITNQNNLVNTNPEGASGTGNWILNDQANAGTLSQITAISPAVTGNVTTAIQGSWGAATRSWSGFEFDFGAGSETNYLKQGVQYTLSFYGKLISGDGACAFKISNADSTSMVTPSSTSVTLTTSWARYSVTFIAPINSTLSPSKFKLDRVTPGNAATIQVTAVQIEIGSTASTYTNGVARSVLDPTGFSLYNSSGTRTVFLDGTTGNGTFLGSITSGSTITGATITGGSLSIGSGNAILKADSNGIYLGNATFGSAPFRVDVNGNFTATSATITGTLATGSSIGNNVVTNPSIAPGAITGDKIAANTVATTNLTVGSFQDSAIPNGSFEDLDPTSTTLPASWSGVSAGTATVITRSSAVTAQSGAYSAALQSNFGSPNYSRAHSKAIPVTPGDNWYYSVWYRTDVAATGGYFRIGYFATDPGTSVSDGTYTDFAGNLSGTTSWQNANTLQTVPAGMYWARVILYNYQPNATSTFYFDGIEVRKAVGTANILNAAIKNAQIDQLAVATANIQDLAIVTAKINNLAVNNAKINDVAVDKLTAGNLTVTATLTAGGTINIGNPPSAAGIQINTTGIKGYGAGGTNTFSLLASDGSIALTGPVVTNGSITGATIAIGSANAIFKADTSGIYLGNAVFSSAPFRVDLNGNLTATSATITGTINASGGTFSGTITASGTISGGTLSGATITGGTIAIGSANAIFKADSNGIYLGNAVFGSAPFRVDMNGNVTTTGNFTGGSNTTITGGTFQTGTPIDATHAGVYINSTGLFVYDGTNVDHGSGAPGLALKATTGGSVFYSGGLGNGIVGGGNLSTTAPGVPSGLAINASGISNVAQTNNAWIYLTWTANPAGDYVGNYEVRYRKTPLNMALSAALAPNTTYTSISVTSVPYQIGAGQTLQIGTGTTQNVITTGVTAANAGVTTINVNSFSTGANSFTSGVAVVMLDQQWTAIKTGTNNLRLDNLFPGVTYDFQIRAQASTSSSSAWSATVTGGQAVDNVAPATPTNLIAYKTPRGAALTWGANTEQDFYGVNLRVTTNGGTSWTTIATNFRGTSYLYNIDRSATALNASLQFAIQAVDFSGNSSAWSAATTALTVDGVLFDEILAGNLTVLGTLTGSGGIQTANGGQRVQVDTTGIKTYSAANAVTATLAAGSGSLTLSGNITSSGTITGGTIVGAAHQSDAAVPATGTRGTFLIDVTNGIQLWDKNSNRVLFADINTGNLTLGNASSSGALTLLIGSANSIFKADSNGIYLGNATFASAPFRVDLNGNLTATSATITGTINATSSNFSGNITASGVKGSYFYGDTTTAAPTLPTIPVGSGVGSLLLDPVNGLRFWNGNGTSAVLQAQWTTAGQLTIYSGASIYGSTVATSQSLGTSQVAGVKIDSSGLAIWSYYNLYSAQAALHFNYYDPTNGAITDVATVYSNYNRGANPGGGTAIGGLRTDALRDIYFNAGQDNVATRAAINFGFGSAGGLLTIRGDLQVNGNVLVNPTSSASPSTHNVPVVLASGRFSSQTSIAVSNIPGTFKTIKLMFSNYPAVASGELYVRFNGDATANYFWNLVEASGGAGPVGYSGGAATTYARVGYAVNYAAVEVTIPGYASSAISKSFTALCSRWDSYAISGGVVDQYSCLYAPTTTAVTSITFGIAGGGNLGQYGDYTVLGIP